MGTQTLAEVLAEKLKKAQADGTLKSKVEEIKVVNAESMKSDAKSGF